MGCSLRPTKLALMVGTTLAGIYMACLCMYRPLTFSEVDRWGLLMRFIVGENSPSKRPRLALCASLGWFADF